MVRRRSAATSGVMREAVDDMLKTNTKPEPPAELVPKPTVSNWKPVALNFAGAKKTEANATEASASASEETKKETSTESKPAAVPKAFSAKPFAFSTQFGKPPMPSKDTNSATEGEKSTSDPASTASATATSTPSTTLPLKSTTKPSEIAPLAGSGFKFTANTKWSFGKTAPTADASTSTNTNAQTEGEKKEGTVSPAPAKRTWNFMNNGKPAPLSSHFPAPGAATTEASGAKPGFQFGKNIAAAKASEPSKEVLKDLAASKDDSASKLQDRAPVKTVTGEEQEDTVFTADAKLFEMDLVEKKWIERGVGVFRINRLKTDPTRLRVLMHIKTTLKLILNSPIYPGMIVMPLDKQPTCVKLTAIPIPVSSSSSSSDSATDAAAATAEASKDEKKQPSISVFNLRFRDAETAAKALKEAQDAIKALSEKKNTASTADDSETKKEVTSDASSAAPAAVDASSASQTPQPIESSDAKKEQVASS